MKASKSRRAKGEFLQAYNPEEGYLRGPDKKSGRPALLAGTDKDGNPKLIKIWAKGKDSADEDLREIWRHEVRQLYRLGGYPGASKNIATLTDAGIDSAGYYLVLDLGQRTPVETLLKSCPSNHWLKNPRLPANRVKLWRNISRLVAGLGILHSQGLLHRNIDLWSILASGGADADFLLTGFEWSLRLASSAANATSWKTGPISRTASFIEDWRAFGSLCADLFGANLKYILDTSIPPSDVAEHLTADETRLVRQLVRAERLDRIDAAFVESRIQDILRQLEANVAGLETKFFIVLQLGRESVLSQRIREASGNEIEVDDQDDQLEFVQGDLENPLLLAVRAATGDFRMVLRGSKLNYPLVEYRPQSRSSQPTWEMAYCEYTVQDPATVNVLGQISLQAQSLEIMSRKEATSRFPRLRGKLSSWATLRSEFSETAERPDRLKRLHQALALTQYLEALLAATESFPVEVVATTPSSTEDGQVLLELRLREDPERDTLSNAMKLRPPAKRFEKALVEERRGNEWVLTEARHVGERDFNETRWLYSKRKANAGSQPVFCFAGQTVPVSMQNALLIPGDYVGRDAQLRRRLRALRALADHSELLRMIDDPRLRILDSHEKVKPLEALAQLDESKQTAMSSIVGTVPLFLVQGPPGVGKTRLVSELVQDVFADDQASRLLLTAQSNSAVNHLLEQIDRAPYTKDGKIVIVRCQSRDSKEDAGPYEVSRQTRNLVYQLRHSPLAARSPGRFVKTLSGLLDEKAEGQERRAFEGLLVRGANVVFATTNSYELERMIDEQGQFDWVIIEEAGKAMGGELLAPLLLSYRRLMIGDHKQLAAFGSEGMKRLLKDPAVVVEALQAGEEFIGRALRDPSTDEVLDEVDSEGGDLPALCSLALDCVTLFERMIESEFALQKKKPKSRPIAQRLTLQHRMHPVIAEVVSRAFYDGELKTHETANARFTRQKPPVKSVDEKKLPNAPIVFVDMPWIQTTMNKKEGERYPRWHNPDEVDVVAKLLRLIKATKGADELPSLAILSPYGEQVRRLKARIDNETSAFPELEDFAPAVDGKMYCGTVDSFQGNEADLVIISLVRNNHHSSALSALGFLSDFRRMNVLLSRAKWRMIILGSLSFLRGVLSSASADEDGPDLTFLKLFLDALETQRVAGNAVVIPSSRIG